MVHVQDQQELKLRMHELANQTQTDPAQRDQVQKEAQENERALNDGAVYRIFQDRGRASIVILETVQHMRAGSSFRSI